MSTLAATMADLPQILITNKELFIDGSFAPSVMLVWQINRNTFCKMAFLLKLTSSFANARIRVVNLVLTADITGRVTGKLLSN